MNFRPLIRKWKASDFKRGVLEQARRHLIPHCGLKRPPRSTHSTPRHLPSSSPAHKISKPPRTTPMSDPARQSLTGKVTSKVKPESAKTSGEQLLDTAKGFADSAASTIQPESTKSDSQEAIDTFTTNSNENQETLVNKAAGFVETAANTAGNFANSFIGGGGGGSGTRNDKV